MTLIVCLDNKNGLAFCGRRQSTDSEVLSDIVKTAETHTLWMNEYSARQFADVPVNAHDDFLSKAGENDFCFLETDDTTPYMDKISALILYRWNRDYPSDLRFPLALIVGGLNPQEVCEFSGTSHSKITKEVYVL